ncbi:hypothetical protein ACS0Y7_25085 [Burkholderia gladioli]|uniref:hypothetical protein n=1 Tax=Burkholderia gladioli TaxID=28095 RepID=UPI000BF188D0|nr:hypothetical protein [Burkholderia gladioli]PEH80397.1 hypothetical protein CRM95_36220 [Burkholderia gladioli]
MPVSLSYAQITTQVLNEVCRQLDATAQLDASKTELARARACGAFELWRRLVNDLLAERAPVALLYQYDEARLRAMLGLPR